GRVNVVLTRQTELDAPGCRVARDLDEALEIAHAAGESEAFVIGGAAVYEAALPRAARIYLTRVAARVEGDTYFPELDPGEWRETAREERPAAERTPHAMAFTRLERRAPAS